MNVEYSYLEELRALERDLFRTMLRLAKYSRTFPCKSLILETMETLFMDLAIDCPNEHSRSDQEDKENFVFFETSVDEGDWMVRFSCNLNCGFETRWLRF